MAASPGGARFIAPDASEIARIRAKHTFLKPLTVPANSYPNQPAPIDSLGSWSFVLTRENLPDDVAYRLAKSLHGAEAALCKKLPQACETTAANTVAAAPKRGADPSGGDEVFQGDRGGEVTAIMPPETRADERCIGVVASTQAPGSDARRIRRPE